MKRLATQIEQYQQQVFQSRMEMPLVVLAIMVMHRYLCLIMLVVIVPIATLYHAPPTLTRLLYRMVFRERFALFPGRPCWCPHMKIPICSRRGFSGGLP